MDVGDVVVKPLKDFAKNSARLVKRCTKPDRKGGARRDANRSFAFRSTMNTDPTTATCFIAEFMKVCSRTAVGFIVMGFIGFFVKLLFIVSAGRLAGCEALITACWLSVICTCCGNKEQY